MKNRLKNNIKWVCLILPLFFLQVPVPCWAAEFHDTCEPAPHETEPSAWNFSGWIETGIMLNQYGQKDTHTNGVFNPESGNTIHLENVRHSSFQVNQLWLQLEKQRDRSRFDIGGLVDFNYGTHAFQAVGLDEGWGHGDYYVSLPQIYVEMGYGDFSISAGKFFTAMGLNSSYATKRFFYSTSYEFQTCTDYCAVFGTWDVNDSFSFFTGWTNGEERFFTDLKHNAFLGGLYWKVTPRFQIDYIISAGKNNGESKYLASSLLTSLKLGERWDYSILLLLRRVESLETPGSAGHNGRFGINQELYYTINDQWSLGLGVEWFKHYDNPADESYNIFACRFGVNWKANSRLTLRSEIRYDKFDGIQPFNLSNSSGKAGQFLFGLSAVMTF